MWRLHNLAQTYNVRPSELLGIEDDWEAFCLDSAVSVFCTRIEAELEGVEGKTDRARRTKRETILRRFIPELAKARKFADPGKR